MGMYAVGVIVVAQLFGVSLWFSANSAADDLVRVWHVDTFAIGLLTSAVQLGFIVGTLTLALTGLADRFRASRIFVVAALSGAIANAGFALLAQDLNGAMPWRFAVGLTLAGIYPMGMKMVVGWQPQRAGSALGWLVGMLTLGTALPHALRTLGASLPWQSVVLGSSVLALLAAALVAWVGDGPHSAVRKSRPGGGLSFVEAFDAFRLRGFRAAALGYFGHMWELYAFWALVPVLVRLLDLPTRLAWGNVSGLSFLIIGAGAAGCIAGGAWSRRIGSARVAAGALTGSALCCAVLPLLSESPAWLLMAVMLFWGLAVVADSPQFSALAMQACPPDQIGSALALQTCIGFSITMASIALTTHAVGLTGVGIAWWLLPGPLLGLWGLWPALVRQQPTLAAAKLQNSGSNS